ncbi:MAG: DNA polymerase IV [Proteobacteria bacterium]|nr:DNA polymerase IV [Pseudomonadota bacterium]
MDRITSLCRDCLAEYESEEWSCARCGSDRLIRHAELGRLSIAHIDCDAFYATIEKRDDPSLADKPVLVGGEKRGVVSTACYIARKYGPRSAMPMFKALQMCPHAVVIKPNMAKYKEVSRQVHKVFETATPMIEALSLDEAFLDLSGTEKLFNRSAAASLAHVAREIEREIRITVSIGLSYNKFLAKLASDLDKPRGFAVIGRGDAVSVLHDLPITRLPGVGPALGDRLKIGGLFTVGDVQRRSHEEMALLYGETGAYIARLAQGIDERHVNIDREAKSVSAETTFNEDIRDPTRLRRILWTLTERVSERLKAKNIAGRTVVLKLKTSRLKTVTRNHKLSAPTQLAETIFREAEAMLLKEATGPLFRLIGVGVDQLGEPTGADPQDLFSRVDKPAGKADTRSAEVEKAMDTVRAKFGRAAIRKGRADL